MRVRRRVGAGVAVCRPAKPDGSAVLLIRRGGCGLAGWGRWSLPGGGKAWWETPPLAARRELREETGLRVGALTRLGVWRGPVHRYTSPDGNVVDWTTHVFVAAYAGGEVRAGDDAAQARWWPRAALPAEVSGATAAYFAALGARA
ncbi:NUDIX hydrolase [Deinococcus petrolearius]|uniref:NUDIX hydrolase n=1 Tax=Deinococcus petrolearius TaxID=1751295 RepID=A0ABW1DID1_9DEIO